MNLITTVKLITTPPLVDDKNESQLKKRLLTSSVIQ